MLKIPLQSNKETIIGIGLFAGACALFVINILIALSTLIHIYGAKPAKITSTAIDGTVISEAVKVIDDIESAN